MMSSSETRLRSTAPFSLQAGLRGSVRKVQAITPGTGCAADGTLTVNLQPSTLNLRPSNINPQPSTIIPQP